MPKNKNEKRPGRKIADNKVVSIWKCPECGHEAVIPPTFYGEAGSPMCSVNESKCNGQDMEYVETRILK